jgi:hypothetical protein
MIYKKPTKLGKWDLGDDWKNVDDILEWILTINSGDVHARHTLGMYEISRINTHSGCPQSIKDLTQHIINTYGPIEKVVGFLAIDDSCIGYGWHLDAWDLVVCNYIGGSTTWEFTEFNSIELENHQLMYVPQIGKHQVIGKQSRFSIAFCLKK